MVDDIYTEIKDHFAKVPEVLVLSGTGAQGIKYGKKLFVMFIKGEIALRLPPERVTELIETGEGKPFDPGTGKPMKNWIIIPASKKDTWITLSEEAQQLMKKQ